MTTIQVIVHNKIKLLTAKVKFYIRIKVGHKKPQFADLERLISCTGTTAVKMMNLKVFLFSSEKKILFYIYIQAKHKQGLLTITVG